MKSTSDKGSEGEEKAACPLGFFKHVLTWGIVLLLLTAIILGAWFAFR